MTMLKLRLGDIQVLDKCPLLGEVYVDAWPITSYLRIALKYHQSPETRLRILQQQQQQQHKNELLKVCFLIVLSGAVRLKSDPPTEEHQVPPYLARICRRAVAAAGHTEDSRYGEGD